MPVLHRLVDPFLPEGLVRLLHYRQRLLAMGKPGRWAISRRVRVALELTRFELLPPLLRRNLRTVVDVGANVGQWTVGIHLIANPTKIIAFEPLPSCATQLREAVGNLPGVRCIEAAVGASVGSVDIYQRQVSELSSVRSLGSAGRRFHGQTATAPKRTRVPLTTLDAELRAEPQIDLLKVDVQGYEDQVLLGAKETLAKTRALMIEALYSRDYYNGALDFEELYEVIKRYSDLRLWVVSPPEFSCDGEPTWADLIFVRYNNASL